MESCALTIEKSTNRSWVGRYRRPAHGRALSDTYTAIARWFSLDSSDSFPWTLVTLATLGVVTVLLLVTIAIGDFRFVVGLE